jgi:Flp pilus assembly protein TadG
MIAYLIRRLRRAERGQALVEFAITIPLLLVLLLGIVDFARAWNVYQVLTDAGREGTRRAVVDNGSTQAEVRTVIKTAAARAGIALEDADIAIAEGSGRGDPTTITISYGYELKFVGGLFGILTGDNSIDYTIVSTMRRE